jgi:alkylation response protein AidB-like acyl-CoA dehydrogenase
MKMSLRAQLESGAARLDWLAAADIIAAEIAKRAAKHELAGGASFYRDMGLERAFRDVQAARSHPLQEKPQLRFSGRVALGLDIDG